MEFEGFDVFWKRSRQFWGLAESLRIYHESTNAWALLGHMEKRSDLDVSIEDVTEPVEPTASTRFMLLFAHAGKMVRNIPKIFEVGTQPDEEDRL